MNERRKYNLLIGSSILAACAVIMLLVSYLLNVFDTFQFWF